jgi:hypothetical protein
LGALTGFHFRAPEILKNWKSEIRPRGGLLEIGPERRRFRRHGGRDAEGETAREIENLAAWGGESGRGPRASRKFRVRRGEGGRISGIQFSKNTDPQKASVSG